MHTDEIDLSQYELKDTLNPSIWVERDGEYVLRPGVLDTILKIVGKFWDSVGMEDGDIEDIYLLGSSCNYNWNDDSDIDVHIVSNFADIDDNIDVLEDYFKTKARNWNDSHANLHIGNTPVELFVQDVNDTCQSTAVYSIVKNEWIKQPSRDVLGELSDNEEIKNEAALLMTIIDGMQKIYNKSNTKEEYSELYDDIQNFLGQVLDMRKKGLSRGGEMDKENIVYKVLRKTGHLQIIWDLQDAIFDKIYSQD